MIQRQTFRFPAFEFWPAWLTYAPLVPYILYLSIRNRSFMAPASSNPFLPLGGMVGESKSFILGKLDPSCTLPHVLIETGELDVRLVRFDAQASDERLSFPLVLKPDAGQRGAGVRLIQNRGELSDYLVVNLHPVIAQAYHPGPFEAGVFYYRYPGQTRGNLLSITDKVWPEVLGDGTSTLQELVESHHRFSLQKSIFKKRHKKIWKQVLSKGTRMRLCFAGNHCQGTLFLDGSQLMSEALLESIDKISLGVEGFYFGRYDIRYSSKTDLIKGRDFWIVELNGATSESTNIYDPDFGLFRSYLLLFKQWKILFEIGKQNILRGEKSYSVFDIVRTVYGYYAGRKLDLVSQ